MLKYAYNISEVFISLFKLGTNFSWLKFASIIGLSYYVLSAIGYLIDVYWQNCKADKNPADVALFIFYFPQLISGPFTRFSNMNEQFGGCHSINYEAISMGIRRMIFGYFKKLVISERFGIIVSYVFDNYPEYNCWGIVLATLCYAVQLYTDFSGCMDIISGASMMFGIVLPENFKAPFFSETVQEFWQRWHITLGLWFKDYLLYPLQKSRAIQAIGKWSKTRFGKKAGKKIPFFTAMIILWIMIGIWHGGTSYYFIASAVIPCTLLLISSICQPISEKMASLLKMNREHLVWRLFRRIRTLLLICICWTVVCANGTNNAVSVFLHMLNTISKIDIYNFSLSQLGFSYVDVIVMLIGVVTIIVEHINEYKGSSIQKMVDDSGFAIKTLIIYSEILAIMFFGMVGTSTFIYFQF